MNIFVVHKFPGEAAKLLCDQHLRISVLAVAKICSSAMYLNNCWEADFFQPLYLRHPWVRWCSLTTSNYRWLVSHGLSLCQEYERRFEKEHATRPTLVRMDWIRLGDDYPINELTIPPAMVPPQYKTKRRNIPETAWEDLVESYRRYYRYKMREMPKFTYKKTIRPYWLDKE